MPPRQHMTPSEGPMAVSRGDPPLPPAPTPGRLQRPPGDHPATYIGTRNRILNAARNYNHVIRR